VESFLLDIPEVSEKDKRAATARAKRYFSLAVEYARSFPPAMLVITCGLSASGKSFVASQLAPLIDAEIISSDVTRKRLAGLTTEGSAAVGYKVGIYSDEMNERTYAALFDEARKLLLNGGSVILDAAFLRRDHRRAAARLARETGAQFASVHVTADEADIRKRMERRETGHAGPSDARWNTYLQQKRRFQRPTEITSERRLSVNTSRPLKRQIAAALSGLRALSPLSVPTTIR
jgi:hypothetical protein